MVKDKITTIKLAELTKFRLDHFKIHRRETYDEVVQRLLEILNITRQNPMKAQSSLIQLEKQRKMIK